MKTTATDARRSRPASRPKRRVRDRALRRLVDDVPSREEARRRILSKPSFFATLSPEARAFILSGDGPDFLGPPDVPTR